MTPLRSHLPPVNRNDPDVLDKLAKSPLGDVLWKEITDDQIRRVMRGERVEPYPYQRSSMRNRAYVQ